jgi:hypothetical protein
MGAERWTIMSRSRAFVPYTHPSYAELRASFDRVSDAYDGLLFTPIVPCQHVPQTPREISFELYRLDDPTVNEEILAELRHDNLRPAMYEEGQAYAAARLLALAAEERFPMPYEEFTVIGSTASQPVEDAGDLAVGVARAVQRTAAGTGIRSFATFRVARQRSELGLLFDIGFLDEGTTILAVRE